MQVRKRIAEILKTIVLLAALIFFIVIAVFQAYESFSINDTASRIVLGVNGTGSETFGSALKGHPAPMGELIAIVSDGNFTVIDSSAGSKTTENFMLSDPILHSKGNYCVVADYGSDDVRLYEKGEVITRVETEGKIISVVTNTNGFFAVATEETGYNAVITVYKKNGKAIYRYRIAENTFIDMDLSANNRKMIVVEANLSSGSIGSNVVVVDFNRKDAENVFFTQDVIYVNVHFNKNGSFVCVGSDRADVYRADCALLKTIDYKGRKLIGADVNNDDLLSFAFHGVNEGETGVSSLEIFDKKGNVRGSVSFENEIEHICVNGGYVAVSHGEKLDIVKANGKIKKSFGTTSPIKYAAPFSDGNAAVIFSGGNTTVVK